MSQWSSGTPEPTTIRAKDNVVIVAQGLAHFAPFTTYSPIQTSCHQQCLAKNPGGYCGLGGTGVSCPTGVGVKG